MPDYREEYIIRLNGVLKRLEDIWSELIDLSLNRKYQGLLKEMEHVKLVKLIGYTVLSSAATNQLKEELQP